MTKSEPISLPPGWSELPAGDRDRTVVAAYQYVSEGNVKLIGSVRETNDGEQYDLELSTITPARTIYRHDFSVGLYDSRTTALSAMEDFLALLSDRLSDDAISPDDPQLRAIRETCHAFPEKRVVPSLYRLYRRLRR